jgi:RimJ/RimL family protein N-acetyltransferase
MPNSILYKENGRMFRELEYEDIFSIKKWRNAQLHVLRQMRPLTDNDQEKWFKHVTSSDNQAIFSILEEIDVKNHRLIGYCGLVYIDFHNKRAELSFLVDPSRVNNQAIYEQDFKTALSFLCSFGFERLKLRRIFTETFDFRTFHLSILESFGFQREGIFRKHQFTNGGCHDSIIHSILIEEWNEKLAKNRESNDFKK